jgi:hypothetical protein
MQRRRVVRWLLLFPLGYPVIRWGYPFISKLVTGAWKHELRILSTEYAEDMKALTRALLPSSLGAVEAATVTADFMDWLERQDPNAELNHLGSMLRRQDIVRSRPGTRRALVGASNYLKQLEMLRSQTRPRRLEDVDRANLETLLTLSLLSSGAQAIPQAPTGENLLLDLLSFFYTRPSATDLFLGRHIAPMTCRGLDGVDRMPAPLSARPAS